MRASDFVKDQPKRVLTIFDIDDTLFHTTAKINVVKDGEVVRSLTNQEFNTYELKDGEEYDFGEFRNAEKFRQESEPIGPMLDELKTILDHTRGKVIMLTARADFDNKETFLQTFADHGIDMSKIHVHRAGNLPGKEGPAEKKAVWVRRYLDTGKFNQVSLYDDSMTNLQVFKELEQEYPDVEFYAHHITGDGDVRTLEERKKRKRRSKYGAAWGPGPYGLYGYNAGYSGVGSVPAGDGGAGGDGGGGMESRLNEAWTQDKQQRIKEFALWAIKLLEIEQAPRIKLVQDSGTTALGYFDPDTKNIVVTVKDRHQMDIMRTLAHELVHRKQNEARELNGATGSPDENEANALAGVLLRWWGKKHPDQFNEGWSAKYKRSINCGNPKGFSQRAHCQGRKKEEDQHPNDPPQGPEFKPTMPAGTVRVDVSDVYDWYKLGMHISNLKGLGKHDFGKGPPSTVLSFGSEEEEHEYIKALASIGLDITDIDPKDPKQPRTMKKVKTDPTYNVNENLLRDFAPAGSGGDKPPRGPKNKGRDPWDDNSGEDPYSRPDPEYYERSIDFFGRFEADHFDDEVFDKETGIFKGYWDDEEGRVQIAYFKFDDPEQTGSDDPGMGWYYEPQTESLLREFAPAGGDGGNNYGGDIYDILMGHISQNYPDLMSHFGDDLVDTVVSNMVSMGSFENIDPENTEDLEDAVANILTQLEDENLNENFADGRNPQDKGDSKRHGIKKGMTIAQLKKIRSSKTASPRKKQLAHWQINMRQGKKK